MADQPKFINTDGEVFSAKDTADADAMRRAGVPEADGKAVQADAIQKQYSATWTDHPALAAFNTLEAGALGVAKGIPGLTTAARGYTQAYDALTGQYGAQGSVTQNFDDYMQAESANHPVMDMAGQGAGMAATGTVSGTLVGNSVKNIVGVGAAQGFGYALDQAASDHLLAPDGAEKAGALTAQLAIGAILGGASAKFADAALSGGLMRGGITEASSKVSSLGASLISRTEENAVTRGAEAVTKNAGKVAMGLGAAGIHGAGGLAAGVAGAAKAIGAVANPRNAGKVIMGLGKAMEGFDKGVAKAVASGLSEEHVVGLTTGLLTHAAYDQVSQRLAVLGNKPTELIPKLSVIHADAGTDPREADVAVQQQARGVAYLADSRPKPNFGAMDSVAPVQQSVGLRQKAEFMDKVNAVQNPTWALANPNAARMEAVKAVYPVLANAVTGLVAQHASTMPGMPLRNRQWAAQITGRAATPMGNPRIQAILALQGQIEQAKKQAPKSGMNGASGGGDVVDSTQAERLAK